MDSHDLTPEQKDKLRRLLALSDERLDSIVRLADKESDLLSMLEKNRAYSIVMAAVKRVAGWVMVISSAIAIGSDSLNEFIRGVIS